MKANKIYLRRLRDDDFVDRFIGLGVKDDEIIYDDGIIRIEWKSGEKIMSSYGHRIITFEN